MKLSKDIRHGRHCVSALHVHLVFVTKYRRKVFDRDALERLQAIFEKVCLDFQARLVEINGEAEHVHLLIHYPPKHSVSSLVNSLKGVSSRLLRSERPDMEKRYSNHVLWSPSYFAASCGGAPLGMIKQYVRQQKTPL
jgi:putative transposase